MSGKYGTGPYSVIVGNIGTVTHTNVWEKALMDFNEYAEQSKSGYGRASGEEVTLFCNRTQEVIREYIPKGDDHESN